MSIEKLSRLEKFRFTKIEASVAESIDEEERALGKLITGISASIEEPTEVKERKISHVSLELIVNGKVKDSEKDFFTIQLEIKDLVSWLRESDEALLQEQETIIEVFNPFYAILLQEAMLIATKLQVGSLQKIAPDIRTAIERAI